MREGVREGGERERRRERGREGVKEGGERERRREGGKEGEREGGREGGRVLVYGMGC